MRFYRAFFRWGLPCGIFLWILVFLCFNVFADEDYFYGVIKASLTTQQTLNGERLVPDVPFTLYSYYAVKEGGADITYSRDLKLKGTSIMACVAVKKENEEALKDWEGYIGETFDDVKITQDYTKHYPYTIADVKRTYDKKTNEPIEYLGANKDDPARFSQWCE